MTAASRPLLRPCYDDLTTIMAGDSIAVHGSGGRVVMQYAVGTRPRSPALWPHDTTAIRHRSATGAIVVTVPHRGMLRSVAPNRTAGQCRGGGGAFQAVPSVEIILYRVN